MSDNTIFSDLIVTADSHEQANCSVKTRVICLQKFVEENGGCFQVEHLGDGYGLDYKVEGYFNGKEVSLGIEYKQFLGDFIPNHATLEKRLGAAREHYDNIALVIEGEALARTSRLVGDKNIWYVNPAVQDGLANQLMNRQMFEDRMQVWAESGILVRNIKQEEDFPDTFLYLLEYITKPDDWYSKHKIDLPNTTFKNQYINMILSLGIDKIGLKTAQKITTIYPNPYWLIVDGEDNLKDNIGKVTGGKLFDFFNNKDLITVEWQNGGNKAQLSKETEKSLVVNLRESSEVLKEVSNPELKYLDENKGKCIEVPKGKYQNGGQLFDVVDTKLKQEVLNLIKQNPKGIEYKKACDVFVVQGYTEDNFYQATKSLMQDDGEIYEPKLGLLVATNPLQSSSAKLEGNAVREPLTPSSIRQPEPQSAEIISQTKKEPSTLDTPASQTLAGAGSKSLDDSKGKADETIIKTVIDNGNHGDVVDRTHCSRFASSDDKLPEPPDNIDFKANPRLKDVVEFIRRHPRTTEDVGKEFGFSPEYCLKALYALKDEHKKVWFNKESLCWEFGISKEHSPIRAEPELDIGV